MLTQTTNCPSPHYKAQFGEDRILDHIFNHKPTGYYIEVGAYDGVTLSNTYYFEQIGWSGILIDPIHPLCVRAAAARPNSRVVHAACSRPDQRGVQKFTITDGVPVLSYLKPDPEHVQRCLREGARLVEVDVPVTTLDDIIMVQRRAPLNGASPWRQGRGWHIDFVSIDVEGAELDVLEGFNLDRFKPSILVIENERESGQAIEPHLAGRGYRKFFRRKINDFFVRHDCHDDFNLTGLETLLPP